ncbi:MAG: hypothetical protein ABFC63_04620 [Thermoguttaceae bacterium]
MTVLHLTRHGEMEIGKDVIAVDRQGTPYAYQLKTPSGPRITMSEWRNGIASQVHDLVTTAVVHPSLPKTKPHRSFLVTNKGIDESVIRAIGDMNRRWEDAGQSYLKLETIVGGELLRDAIDLGTNLWPSELSQSRDILELFLQDGTGPLQTAKLCGLLQSTLQLDVGSRPSQSSCHQRFSSAGLLTAIAESEHARQQYHVAQIEAWTLYCCHVLAVAERWSLSKSVWMPAISVAKSTIWSLLEDLVAELRERKNMIEGDPINDNLFRRGRITRLVGFVSLFALWKRADGGIGENDEFAKEFCGKHRGSLWLWGEAAVPLLLAFYWFWRKVDATPSIDSLLSMLISGICEANGHQCPPDNALPNPYYSESEVLAARLGISDEPIEEDFRKHSYTLESIVHLFARLNWKMQMTTLWPSITHVWFNRFEPAAKWQFFLWRAAEGTHWDVAPRYPKQWSELRAEAEECNGNSVPEVVRNDPILLALILCVCPHRLTADVARWLDTQLADL